MPHKFNNSPQIANVIRGDLRHRPPADTEGFSLIREIFAFFLHLCKSGLSCLPSSSQVNRLHFSSSSDSKQGPGGPHTWGWLVP